MNSVEMRKVEAEVREDGRLQPTEPVREAVVYSPFYRVTDTGATWRNGRGRTRTYDLTDVNREGRQRRQGNLHALRGKSPDGARNLQTRVTRLERRCAQQLRPQLRPNIPRSIRPGPPAGLVARSP